MQNNIFKTFNNAIKSLLLKKSGYKYNNFSIHILATSILE